MLKYTPLLFALYASAAVAGSSSIDLTGDYNQVFTTPSGNVLCGGDSRKNPKAKLYRHDLYCYVYHNKAMPKKCTTNPNGQQGLDFMLNAKGKPTMQCAYFEFDPFNEGEAKTRTLQYGETLSGKGWTCTSEPTGLRCKNHDGHGFFLNRSRYELF